MTHPGVVLANTRIRRLPYNAVNARAGVALAAELLGKGGNNAMLGGAMIRGVCKGLGQELTAKKKYPVCQFCGKRHP